MDDDHAQIARDIIDSNLYMVLGTADGQGQPWTSPVYYAPSGYQQFLWLSRPWRRHSQNIVERAEVSIVIFDSSVPINTGQGVYLTAEASQLNGDESRAAIEVFSERSISHGGDACDLFDVQEPAEVRLYRAVATGMWILDPGTDDRVPVSP